MHILEKKKSLKINNLSVAFKKVEKEKLLNLKR